LTGMQATETFTRELLEEVEKIFPGCTAVLNK